MAQNGSRASCDRIAPLLRTGLTRVPPTQMVTKTIARRFYYALKPYLGWQLRSAFRRWLARRTLRSSTGVWPVLESSGQKPEGWRGWPEEKEFAFILTHDVEDERGLNRVKQLAELEKELGFHSSFNLVPEGEYLTPKELRDWLAAEGFEVGVHDLYHDGSLFRSHNDFQRQAAVINHHLRDWGAVGFRAGFMFHDLDWIRELEIEYDSSTFDTDPFEPQPDGAGTIFPFWVLPNNGRPGYVELPYTLAQDSTLFLLLQEGTSDIWKRKVDWVAQHGGMALVNVHPDYLTFEGEPPSSRQFPVARYRELLSYVKDRYVGKFWNVLPRDLARWFRAQVSRRCCGSPLISRGLCGSLLEPR
jgi:hypothetical protein